MAENNPQQDQMKQKHQQLQMIDQQLQMMQQQGQLIDKQLSELLGVEQALEEFKDVKEGAELLIPFSSGIYARGTMQDSKQLIVNVGSGTAVERDIDDVRKMITEQREEMQKMQEEVSENMQKLAHEGVELQQDLQKLV